MQKQYEHLVHSSAQEKEKLLQTLTQLHDSSARLETTVSSVGYGSEHRDQLEGRILEVERSLQNLSDTTEQFGATLEKVYVCHVCLNSMHRLCNRYNMYTKLCTVKQEILAITLHSVYVHM